jgi:hypothetical protein
MSTEPPIVDPVKIVGPVRPLREVLPGLATRAEEMGIDVDHPKDQTIFATRTLAREVLAARSDVSPTGAVYIDCRRIRAMSSPFIDELLEAWPLAQPLGAVREVQDDWDFVVKWRKDRKRDA